jgi:pimeloyl-ACP methyl ester carboxylesterase
MKRKVALIILAVTFAVLAGYLLALNMQVSHFEKQVKALEHIADFSVTPVTPIEHRALQREGYAIHYFVSGPKSGELVIFLHPAFADHRCFDKQVDTFSRKYRVVTVDLLGHGLSSVAQAKETLDASAEHVAAILKLEGHTQAHVVGVSMGTLIAQYFALHHPDQVASLALLGGYDINADNQEVLKAQRQETFKWIFKAVFSMDAFRLYVASISVSHPEEQARFYAMARLFTRKSFMVMPGLGKILEPRPPVRHTYPLLLLCGDGDLELARRVNQAWHASDPASRFVLIRAAGHCANMDNAEAFNEAVMTFIQSHK